MYFTTKTNANASLRLKPISHRATSRDATWRQATVVRRYDTIRDGTKRRLATVGRRLVSSGRRIASGGV